MNHSPAKRALELLVPLARLGLGALFIYMGLVKAAHPVEFLKLVRQYELTESSTLLNLIAATLPWFEVFTGALLVCGVAVRGAALVSIGMLVPFTLAVIQRALALQQANGTPFCLIRFNCGCGGGEVAICGKILENSLLILAALLIVFVQARRGALRYTLFSSQTAAP